MDISDVAGMDRPITVNEKGGGQSEIPVRFDLIDGKALFKMAHVLDEGAKKHGDNNWRLVDIDDHLNHLIMHAYAYLAGDRSDEHLSHIMCRAMFAQAVEIQEDAAPIFADNSAYLRILQDAAAAIKNDPKTGRVVTEDVKFNPFLTQDVSDIIESKKPDAIAGIHLTADDNQPRNVVTIRNSDREIIGTIVDYEDGTYGSWIVPAHSLNSKTAERTKPSDIDWPGRVDG